MVSPIVRRNNDSTNEAKFTEELHVVANVETAILGFVI